MNSVERVKLLCKERKIPISRLERDLGFANGYIGQLRKGVFPADRLAMIANYLGVGYEYLATGEEAKENALTTEGGRSLDTAETSESSGRLKLLARHLDRIPEETRDRLLKNFEDTIDTYLDAMGIPKEE